VEAKKTRLVIGLTGLPSSGKGEVTLALQRLASARGWRAEHLSFSDQIKDEARARGIADNDFTRELLSQIGIEMREAEGPGVLANRLARKIRSWPDPAPDLFVVEALRHTGEVDALKAAFGDAFTLIAVECEPRLIARRLIARQRPDESPDAMQSEEAAIRLLESELNGQLSSLGPNVSSCAARADVRLANNGTLSDLYNAVSDAFESLAKTKPPPLADT